MNYYYFLVNFYLVSIILEDVINSDIWVVSLNLPLYPSIIMITTCNFCFYGYFTFIWKKYREYNIGGEIQWYHTIFFWCGKLVAMQMCKGARSFYFYLRQNGCPGGQKLFWWGKLVAMHNWVWARGIGCWPISRQRNTKGLHCSTYYSCCRVLSKSCDT